MKVLVLGGTSESRTLAALLADEPSIDAVTSLAGRTKDPVLPQGRSRIGGFGGREGLAEWIETNAVDVVVDATHPFASVISETASAAASRTGVPLVQLVRSPWVCEPTDDWISVASLSDAAAFVESNSSRTFLTIGRQGIRDFAHIERTWFLVRSIDPPDVSLPPKHELLLERGPFGIDEEISLLENFRIDTVVTKNSGGAMTSAKLAAARRLEIPVVMVARPPHPPADYVTESAAEIVLLLRSWL